jgi:hypothetical protein
MKSRKWPIKIRLYPHKNSSLYALVHIWKNRKTFHAHENTIRRQTGEKLLTNTNMAVCCGVKVIDFRRGKKGKTKGVFAEIHFSEENLNLYILSHELTHATFAWVERIGYQIGKDECNEEFCHTQDSMLYQLYCRIAKLKLGGWSY